jgi:hypothetical protein
LLWLGVERSCFVRHELQKIALGVKPQCEFAFGDKNHPYMLLAFTGNQYYCSD